MKTLTALCFGVLLTACTPLMANLTGGNQSAVEGSADQQLFIKGLEQLTQQQDTEALLRLKNSFPKSPWTARAEVIMTLTNQISRQELQLTQLQGQLDELSSDRKITRMEEQINRCAADNQRLQNELSISNKRLEALRELTIELELKQP